MILGLHFCSDIQSLVYVQANKIASATLLLQPGHILPHTIKSLSHILPHTIQSIGHILPHTIRITDLTTLVNIHSKKKRRNLIFQNSYFIILTFSLEVILLLTHSFHSSYEEVNLISAVISQTQYPMKLIYYKYFLQKKWY